MPQNIKIPFPPLLLMIFLFLTPFIVYILTLSPTFFHDDSPEIITACCTLGISHPPGYPLYTLMGRLTELFQLFNPALQFNLYAAVLASFGGLLLGINLWLLLYPSFQSRAPSTLFYFLLCSLCAFGTFSLSFSKNYWEAALTAKGGLYILQAVINLTILIFLQLFIQKQGGTLNKTKSPSSFLLLFFLFAVALCNHWQTQFLFIPSLLFCLYLFYFQKTLPKDRQLRIGFINILWTLTVILIGLSPYLFLPLRSNLHPALNFGAPYTFNRFLNCVTREQAREFESNLSNSLFSQRLPSADGISHIFGETFPFLEKKITYSLDLLFPFPSWLFIFLFLTGFLFLWRNECQKIPDILLFTFLTSVTVPLLYQRLTPPEFWHLDDYLLTPVWIEWLVISAGIGLFFLNFLNNDNRLKPPHILLLKILIALSIPIFGIMQVSKNYGANDQKGKLLYYNYGLEALRSLDRGAIYFAETDYDFFSTSYLRNVELLRTDSSIFLTGLFREPYEYVEAVRSMNLSATSQAPASPFDSISKTINYSSRPVFFTFSNGSFVDLFLSHLPGYRFRLSGILLHWVTKPEKNSDVNSLLESNDFWNKSLKALKSDRDPSDYLLLDTCAHPFLNIANYLKTEGNLSNWDLLYDRALSLMEEKSWIAETWDRRAEGDKFLGNTNKVLLDLENSAKKYLEDGAPDKSLRELQMALVISPNDNQAKRMIALLDKQAK